MDTKSLSASANESIAQSGLKATPPSTESAAPILHLRGVGRRFGGLRAVADVTLAVKPGERRAILGPNGAGKTTLFNVISGEFAPTEGTIELFGKDVTHQPARLRARSGLSRTFQTSRLLLGLSVEDNLYLAVLGAKRGHLLPIKLPRLERQIRELAFGEYLEVPPGRWLVWLGGGPLGPRRYACAEHRGDLCRALG